jgi:hypothetical protein
MKTNTVIETEAEQCTLGYWDETKEEWVVVTDDNVEKMTKLLGVNPKLMSLLRGIESDITESIANDLKAIWKRLDSIEGK